MSTEVGEIIPTHKIIRIKGVLKNYAWGSLTTLAKHRGDFQSIEPEAELWFGDNVHGTSGILDSSTTLDEVTKDFGSLDFLVKILAVEKNLSLQVHPALEDIPPRSAIFKDKNHKPEMLVALTEFHALAGFAPIGDVIARISSLQSDKLNALLIQPLQGSMPFTQALNNVLGVIDREGILDEVRAGLGNVAPLHRKWLGELLDQYAPKLDPLALLLCEFFVLTPGEAIYIPPRCIHAYLHGSAIEVMANSDNVVRGGLTNKAIDKSNFLALADESVTAQKVDPEKILHLTRWRAPIGDFQIQECRGHFSLKLSLDRHSIAFCWEGSATIAYQSEPNIASTLRYDVGAFLQPGEYLVSGEGSLWVASGKGR